MDTQTDQQLLWDYAGSHSESAFAELVRRHIDLVYSAAMRMVCDAHQAQDVTQGTFVALAQNARQLTHHPVLSGWLHCTTRNLAANAVRSEVRRRAREQEVVAMNQLLSAEPEATWEHIAPHLDAALGELSEPDRDALLLRYFERKSAQEMAASLGISADAAQKRVSRAVERLREFFAKRGVTVGASGLVVVISANAVQAAPIGLAVTISTAAALAGTSIATTATATTAKAIAMTALQKTIITATVAVLAGAGIYEARQASQFNNQIQTLQRQPPLSGQIEQLRRERGETSAKVVALQKENDQLRGDNSELLQVRNEAARLRNDSRELAALKASDEQVENDPARSEMRSWVARVDQLKKRIAETPGASTPELRLATQQDWFEAAQGKLDTDEAYRYAMGRLRILAGNRFGERAKLALKKYIRANQGQFPTEVNQLKSYFDPPIDEAVLQRYEVVPAKGFPRLGPGDWIIVTKEPVDKKYDSRTGISPNGYTAAPFGKREPNKAISVLGPAIKAFSEANYGLLPFDHWSELTPYVTTDEQRAALEQMLRDR